jgi:hypothetical protein
MGAGRTAVGDRGEGGAMQSMRSVALMVLGVLLCWLAAC